MEFCEKQQEYVEAYKRALQIMPEAESIRIKTSSGTVQGYCWKNATHSLPMEYSEELNSEIIQFIGKNSEKIF